MYRTELNRRTTYHYRDAWSHLDAWSVGRNAKVFPERILRYDEKDDTLLSKGYVEFEDKSVTLREAHELIRANLAYVRCRHEYDCCGCSIRCTQAVYRIGRGRFGYLMRITYNV